LKQNDVSAIGASRICLLHSIFWQIYWTSQRQCSWNDASKWSSTNCWML